MYSLTAYPRGGGFPKGGGFHFLSIIYIQTLRTGLRAAHYSPVMWPFSKPSSSTRRDPDEERAGADVVAELARKLKVIERELDDLHAAYRRRRAIGASNAVDRSGRSPGPAAGPGATDPAGARVNRKTALREKARRMQHGPVQSDV